LLDFVMGEQARTATADQIERGLFKLLICLGAKEWLRNNFPFLEHMTVQPEREGVACSELHTSCLLGAKGCVKGS
jgi:hypothetical protein